jgi:hypothetical protein
MCPLYHTPDSRHNVESTAPSVDCNSNSCTQLDDEYISVSCFMDIVVRGHKPPQKGVKHQPTGHSLCYYLLKYTLICCLEVILVLKMPSIGEINTAGFLL